MKYICFFNEITKTQSKFAGGKGSSLITMKKAGLPVPEGLVILSTAFENGILSEDAKRELFSVIEKMSDKYTYAVRSSAIGEDGDNASFAGAYETVLDVNKADILQAVLDVLKSADAERVKSYAENRNAEKGNISIVIQHFVKPQFAGVLFTSDIITGSSAKMVGNYVDGVGESLVSGTSNAKEFSFDALKYSYKGNDELKPYAKKLYKYAVKIRNLYDCPQDIEWAVSDGRLYILQARPITTLRRYNPETYQINGSLSGEYLFSKTNIGEIFMQPLSPATYGILELICDMLGVDCFIDNIEGQAYCNLSVICSLLVSLGFSRKKAYSMIADIAGKLPDNAQIPIFPFNRRKFFSKIKAMVFAKKPGTSIKMNKEEFSKNIANIADDLIDEIHKIGDNQTLYDFWVNRCDEYMTRVMGTIVKGLSIKPLLNTRNKIIEIAGEELANELCSNCSDGGALESMKPLLAIEDVILGKITKEEYVKNYGHRSANEMELSCPYPYEEPNFPDDIIEQHKKSGVNAYELKQKQERRYNEAVTKFKKLYPNKAKWLDKKLQEFSKANYVRENLRSQSVKLFCLMRECLLKAAELNGLGDDIFMLYFTETMKLLSGDKSVLKVIEARRKTYNSYLEMPAFPNIIIGRFEPKVWIKDKNRRLDVYCFGESLNQDINSDIKGYAGAAGIVEGTVRVITDLSEANTLMQGEILVTTATNIGWTTVFPKAAAIITDIGAPLSHAAIVAREFGIPAVVGCGNAVQELRTGDRVKVDGANGVVFKLN